MTGRRHQILNPLSPQVIHITSHLHGKEDWWSDTDKEALRRMIWRCADFSGLKIITYCLMSNHFHILVECPVKGTLITNDELARRYAILYPKDNAHIPSRPSEVAKLLRQTSPNATLLRRRLQARMHDVSEFAKTLKQRFSRYLKHHANTLGHGALWKDRFHATRVENTPFAVQTVAAYIDLNPVRAGLVTDPKDYRFCGYAEALAGNKLARKGLRRATETADLEEVRKSNPTAKPSLFSDRAVLAAYRLALFGKGSAPKHTKDGSASVSHESTHQVIRAKGELSLAHNLLHRLKWMSQGGAIGSAEFVRKFMVNKNFSPHEPPESSIGFSWSQRLRP